MRDPRAVWAEFYLKTEEGGIGIKYRKMLGGRKFTPEQITKIVVALIKLATTIFESLTSIS